MLKNPDKKERTIKKQTVAGFVIFRRTEEGVKYLLLYKRGEYWNFPKGHFEEGEGSLDTALRETEEETGIKKTELRILPAFRGYEKFHFYSDTEKIYDTVILYLAETKQDRVTIVPREHSGYAWFLYPDAIKILRRYAETRRVLKQAHDFIRNQNQRRPGFAKPHEGTPRPAGSRNPGPRQKSKPFSPQNSRGGYKNPNWRNTSPRNNFPRRPQPPFSDRPHNQTPHHPAPRS